MTDFSVRFLLDLAPCAPCNYAFLQIKARRLQHACWLTKISIGFFFPLVALLSRSKL